MSTEEKKTPAAAAPKDAAFGDAILTKVRKREKSESEFL
jgi:hypothetical protein